MVWFKLDGQGLYFSQLFVGVGEKVGKYQRKVLNDRLPFDACWTAVLEKRDSSVPVFWFMLKVFRWLAQVGGILI